MRSGSVLLGGKSKVRDCFTQEEIESRGSVNIQVNWILLEYQTEVELILDIR